MKIDKDAVKAAIDADPTSDLARAARKWLASQGDEDAAQAAIEAEFAVGDVVSQGPRRRGVVLSTGADGTPATVAVAQVTTDEAETVSVSWRFTPLNDGWEDGGELPAEVTEVPTLSMQPLA